LNTWTGTRADLATAYARHTGSLRGALRHALVTRALLTHLPDTPQRILDVGGGAGIQALALARAGHHVTILDPDLVMLGDAEQALTPQPREIAERVALVAGPGEDAAALVGDGFDAVCCHGVLMYLTDPTTMLQALTAAVRPGGLISVLAKNADALAMRPGMEGRWADALDLVTATTETGRLGVTSRADTLTGVQSTLAETGADTVAWYGVRVFTDHLRDTPVGPDFDHILDLEWAAGARDPYRQVARLFHLVARRQTP
jgi:S-adenosylmethionine-dependent methyltransferase